MMMRRLELKKQAFKTFEPAKEDERLSLYVIVLLDNE